MKVLLSVLVVFVGTYFTTSVSAQEKSQFRVIKEWDFINFTWPTSDTYNEALKTNKYLPQNVLISGVMYYKGYYYMSLPRMKEGVPATIARAPANAEATPLLEPFPSWEMNKLNDCDAIQNSQNVEIDTKGQMWIIDIGRTSTLSKNQTMLCPPKIVIYNIDQNKTTRVFHFPEEVVSKNTSFLYDLVIDDIDGGYAYITDNSGKDPGIVVYSLKDNKSWKIRHSRTMKADPSAIELKVDGVMVRAPINIAGIALGPKVVANDTSITINEDRSVYYCPISSFNLYSIQSSALRDKNSANGGNDFNGAVQDIGRKASQTDGMIMDDAGILYYGLLGDSSVAQWDTHTPFASGQKIISRDAVFIQWPNSFTFDNMGNIILLTNRLHKFVYGRMDIREPNFRLLSATTGTNSYLTKENPLSYDTVDTRDEPTTQSNLSTTTEKTESETHMNVEDRSGFGVGPQDGYDHSSIGEDEIKRMSDASGTQELTNMTGGPFEPGRRDKVKSETTIKVEVTTFNSPTTLPSTTSAATVVATVKKDDVINSSQNVDKVNDDGASLFRKPNIPATNDMHKSSSTIISSYLPLFLVTFIANVLLR